MSRGFGRAERAILTATSSAITPLGGRRWLTLAEAAPEIDANSRRRAAHRLAERHEIELSEAWSTRHETTPLRQDQRHGTLLVAPTRDALIAARQRSDRQFSRIAAEYLGRDARETAEPGIPLLLSRGALEEAGRWASDRESAPWSLRHGFAPTKVPELHADIRDRGDDWGREDGSRHTAGVEGYAAAYRKALSRGGHLRTASTLLAWLEYQTAHPWLWPAPSGELPFSTDELVQQQDEQERRLLGEIAGPELLDSPPTEIPDSFETWAPASDDDEAPASWEPALIECGELAPDWFEREQAEKDREAWAREQARLDSADLANARAYLCFRCDAAAVIDGACRLHVCENCGRARWHAKRRCRACAEYVRTHRGQERPPRLFIHERRQKD